MLNPNPNSAQYYDSGIWSKVTLDNLLRKCVVERPEEIALIDPSDRKNWAFGAPKLYAWKHINTAIDVLTVVFSQWKLPAQSAVLVQLPNIAEHVITFFALLRCNYVPIFVEPIAGRFEIQTAAKLCNAQAIITYTHLADLTPALQARDAAVNVLSIRVVAAFGENCPDGVTNLENLLEQNTIIPPRPILTSQENLPAHGMCANVGDETVPIWRSHNHCISSGLMVFLESRAHIDETLIACTPILSPHGMSAALVPWLFSQGKLQLLQPFNDLALRIALKSQGNKRLIISGAQFEQVERFIPTHLAPDHLTLLWPNASEYVAQSGTKSAAHKTLTLTITDVININDIAIAALKREDSTALPMRIGEYHAPRSLSHSPLFLTLKQDEHHNLCCSGAVVAQVGNMSELPYVPISCLVNEDNEIITLTPTSKTASIGALRVGLMEIENVFANHPMIASVHAKAVPDALFGQRIQLLVSGRAKNVNAELILTLVEKHLHESGFSAYKSASDVVIMPNMSGVANSEQPHILDKAL